MKKFILLLIIFCVCINSLFSSSSLPITSFIVKNTIELSDDLENRKHPPYKDLKLQIDLLEDTSDLGLFYKENKVPVLWPTFQNLIFGFGTGSKNQGRVVSSRIYMIADTAVISTALGSALILMFVEGIFTGGTSVISGNEESYKTIFKTALALEIALHSVQALDALIYGSIYNLRLKNDLQLAATINPLNKEVAVKAKILLS